MCKVLPIDALVNTASFLGSRKALFHVCRKQFEELPQRVQVGKVCSSVSYQACNKALGSTFPSHTGNKAGVL